MQKQLRDEANDPAQAEGANLPVSRDDGRDRCTTVGQHRPANVYAARKDDVLDGGCCDRPQGEPDQRHALRIGPLLSEHPV